MFDTDVILEAWNSDVNRWHSNRSHRLRNSGDTNDAHAARCLRLLVMFFPSVSANAMQAVLFHDVGERVVGDVSYLVKRGNAEVAGALQDLEDSELERFDQVHLLSNTTFMQLDFVDRLDSYLWVKVHDPDLLQKDEWRFVYEHILSLAETLSIQVDVKSMLEHKSVEYV